MNRFGWRGLLYGVPLLCVLLLAILMSSWRHESHPAPPEAPPVLRVLCGPSLRAPVEEIAAAFERRRGLRVELAEFVSPRMPSGFEGAVQADVWMPEDAFEAGEAVRRGLVVEEPRAVAWRQAVIQARRGNPRSIQALADLGQPGLRIILPGGLDGALGRLLAGLFDAAEPSMDALRRNLVVSEDPVPPGRPVALGQADAALLWRPNAMEYRFNTEIVEFPADPAFASPVFAAVSIHSAQPEAARDFVRFLSAAAARQTFRTHHYD